MGTTRIERMRKIRERLEKERQDLKREYRRRFDELLDRGNGIATDEIMQINDWYDEAKAEMEARQIDEIIKFTIKLTES